MRPILFKLSLPFHCANFITLSLHGAKFLVSDLTNPAQGSYPLTLNLEKATRGGATVVWRRNEMIDPRTDCESHLRLALTGGQLVKNTKRI